MDWQNLLSRKLLCDEKSISQNSNDGRSPFQRDFDRIVFSSAFRRLQDKTQVFPLPESDFVHTRLTHSFEVSCVGRSLGTLIGSTVIKRHKELKEKYTHFHLGEIVAAACLAHDIGNPPFGHSGEDAIAEYFKNGDGKQFKDSLTGLEWNDLTKFEGNAQGFRLLTKLQNPNIKGGLRLTCATLASFTKYPKESFTPDSKLIETGKAKLFKKFGFFQSEKDLFSEVAVEVGLKERANNQDNLWWKRHPLTFLVEAADDICYRIMDLEDGFHLGLVSFKETEELLLPFAKGQKLNAYNNRDENDKIGYLRAKSISSVVNKLSEIFLDEEKNLLEGKLEADLISLLPFGNVLEMIQQISIEKIYSFTSVVEREAAGYEVIGGLLESFISAANEFAAGNISPKSKTLLKLLPKNFLSDDKTESGLYYRLLGITDFISGMTDSFAVSLYRKIKGISLPGT